MCTRVYNMHRTARSMQHSAGLCFHTVGLLQK